MYSWILPIAAVILAGAGAYVYFSGNGSLANPLNSSGTSSPSGTEAGLRGQAVFSVTDAAMSIRNVNEVMLTVDKVEVQGAALGWVAVSNDTKRYNLLALNASGKAQVLANASLAAGKYQQVRLHVSDAAVSEKSGAVKHAKLPSGELKIVGGFTVATDTSASITFDFMADKSLHLTGQGQYIFAPVVKTEMRSDAQVVVAADGSVSVNGGNVEARTNAGMDIDGTVKANFVLDANSNLELVGGLIRLKAKGQRRTLISRRLGQRGPGGENRRGSGISRHRDFGPARHVRRQENVARIGLEGSSSREREC